MLCLRLLTLAGKRGHLIARENSRVPGQLDAARPLVVVFPEFAC